MRLILIAIAALVLAAGASAANTDTTIVTATISAGPAVNVTAASPPSFALTLNGSDQATSYTLPLVVTDATGSGAGWNLTITSTTFADGGGHTFPSSASTITGATSGCATSSTCTLPANNVADSNLALPAGATPPSAVKFFNATASTGRGTIDVNTTVQVSVPANVRAGSYTSTVTVSAVSGP